MQIRNVAVEIRARRASCEHRTNPKLWTIKGRASAAHEVCSKCGERFPCARNDCEHFDCAERQIDLGLRIDFPPGPVRYLDRNGTVIHDGILELP